ncbi:type 4a pilus biogenesis protein PilO [Sulfurimonas sp. HSL-1716]|uniref:type 4a pilus biogenesis protein PilO n=1 Tax=Hydrocurvibacter sulfurireducens TaxID=3131937 RepID=UPI0031F8EE36
MKTNIEDYLYKIDNVLNQKSKKDLYMLYILIVVSIIALSYLTLFDSSKALFDQEHAKVERLQQKLNVDNEYLRINTELTVAQLDKEIKTLKNQYMMYKDYNEYIKYQIERISSLFYDEQTWGEYIDSISENAKKYNVKILNFNNKYATNSTTFGHVLDINVRVDGTYKNTLKFINSIEQSFLVVDLHNLSMKAEDKLYSDLNISVWGIN